MQYNITKLTNVTIGGSPDIGDAPTSGLLNTAINAIIDLSDAIVYHETMLEAIPVGSESFMANKIEREINTVIGLLNNARFLLDSQQYSDPIDYHDGVAPTMPADLDTLTYR